MKVIGINGSSRKDGNTAIIISNIFDKLNKEGIETELIQLADYEIQPCRGCFACKSRGNCVFSDQRIFSVLDVFLSEKFTKSEYEEKRIGNTSQLSSKHFDFSIE